MTTDELFGLIEVIYPISDFAVNASPEIKQEGLVRVTETLCIDGQDSTKVTTFELCDGGIIVSVYDEDGDIIHKKIMKEWRLREFCEMIIMLKDGIRDF